MFKLKNSGKRPGLDKALASEAKSPKKALKTGLKPTSKPAAKRAVKAGAKAAAKPAGKSGAGGARRPRPTQTAPVVLHKRIGKPVDLGIGAVNIAPQEGTPRTLGLVAAEAAIDKKATDVTLLDVHEISGLCDEMLVASARSVTHLGAVADSIEEAMRKQGERVIHADGRYSAEPDWILLDYGNLMVHIFRPEAREAYRLEAYYAEARLVAKWKND